MKIFLSVCSSQLRRQTATFLIRCRVKKKMECWVILGFIWDDKLHTFPHIHCFLFLLVASLSCRYFVRILCILRKMLMGVNQISFGGIFVDFFYDGRVEATWCPYDWLSWGGCLLVELDAKFKKKFESFVNFLSK